MTDWDMHRILCSLDQLMKLQMTDAQAYIELTIRRPGYQDITVREPIPRLLQVSEGLMSVYSAMSETMDRLHHRAAEAVEMSRRNGLMKLLKPYIGREITEELRDEIVRITEDFLSGSEGNG